MGRSHAPADAPTVRSDSCLGQPNDDAASAADRARSKITKNTDTDMLVDLPPPFKRKRATSLNNYSNSSDPPLFSSDDLQPDGADYTTKRQKRLYPGTWWMPPPPRPHQEPDLPLAKRSFRRNFDSGVFMGSDSSEIRSDDLNELLHGTNPNAQVVGVEAASSDVTATKLDGSPTTNESIAQESEPESHEELVKQAQAAEYVQNCIDREETLVDLSDRRLSNISNGTLEPLRYMLTVQKYKSFVPQIRLYIGNNSLRHIPTELFNLANLTTLSVRNNELTSIPSQIARLNKLREVNVTTNQLRYLPFSFLKLVANCSQRTETLEEFFTCQYRLRPNPFLEPASFDEKARIDCSQVPVSSTLQVKAISTVSYFSVYGIPELYEQPAPSRHIALSKPLPSPQAGTRRDTRIPSLLELCLQSATSSKRAKSMLSDVEAFNAHNIVPNTILRGLRQAVDVSEAGPLYCDVCDREYIIARAEWLEWWTGVRDNEDDIIPFLRRSCSWACAEEANREVASLEVQWRACGWQPPL